MLTDLGEASVFSDFLSLDKGCRVQLIKDRILYHFRTSVAKDVYSADPYDYYRSVALAAKDFMMEYWRQTQKLHREKGSKKIYYLSLEFLIGKSLKNNVLCLGLFEEFQESLNSLPFDFERICECEQEPGLGNGGLGRLAACYVDSMAHLGMSGYGYGLKYQYGIFKQKIVNGQQVEIPDDWIKRQWDWEIARPEISYEVRFGGRVQEFVDEKGSLRYSWQSSDVILATPCDFPVIGYENQCVNSLRLWSARPKIGFDFNCFNLGRHFDALREKVRIENITRVLYPNDSTDEGKKLRFCQQYFFVSASLQDILVQHLKSHQDFENLPSQIAIQLNDTHPALLIPDFMHILMDEYQMSWDDSWALCQSCVSYTNHTILPEALEKWPVSLFEEVLPRHLQIIYEINRRFMDQVSYVFPGRMDIMKNLSLIDENEGRMVRMAHLAIVGSHKVNGVAQLHSRLLKTDLFRDFVTIFPEKFTNVTNGVTPRRWLGLANPHLVKFLDRQLGCSTLDNLDVLNQLKSRKLKKSEYATLASIKQKNKERVVSLCKKMTGVQLSSDMIFDVQIKRIHEYKRQLLKILHVIHLYRQVAFEGRSIYPRAVIFAGKAAPGYRMAKDIIYLINSVAQVVNANIKVSPYLKVVYLPNYSVSVSEVLVPGADLSEQISLAGFEASGTGNMKFALNGALTIGSLDGANIEILDNVGEDHFFKFGLETHEVKDLQRKGYFPGYFISEDSNLEAVLSLLKERYFTQIDGGALDPLIRYLFEKDNYMNCADFSSYVEAQEKVEEYYRDKNTWLKSSYINIVSSGFFSSDRSVKDYCQKIWDIDLDS